METILSVHGELPIYCGTWSRCAMWIIPPFMICMDISTYDGLKLLAGFNVVPGERWELDLRRAVISRPYLCLMLRWSDLYMRKLFPLWIADAHMLESTRPSFDQTMALALSQALAWTRSRSILLDLQERLWVKFVSKYDNFFTRKNFWIWKCPQIVGYFVSASMCSANVDTSHVCIWKCRPPGPRLNIKTVLSTYGDFHVKDKTVFLIETAPRGPFY